MAKYFCKHCGKTVERESNTIFFKSDCDDSGNLSLMISVDLLEELQAAGYKEDGNWWISDDLKIKFNKTSISFKNKRASTLVYANPTKITIKNLEKIIQALP